MRISDWSSDVCASDLAAQQHAGQWCDADPDAADPEPAQRHAERPFNLGMGVAQPDHGEADDREAQCRAQARSEERRVGNECVSTWRSRWSRYHKQKKSRTMSRGS